MNLPIQVWTALIAVVGTILVTWFGSQLSQRQAERAAKRQAERDDRQFRAQRLWDARKEAYAEILKYCRQWYMEWYAMDYQFNDEESDPHTYHGSKSEVAAKRRSSEAVSARNDAFDANMLVLSDDFIVAFMRLREEAKGISDFDPPIFAAGMCAYSKKVFDELLEIARRELAN